MSTSICNGTKIHARQDKTRQDKTRQEGAAQIDTDVEIYRWLLLNFRWFADVTNFVSWVKNLKANFGLLHQLPSYLILSYLISAYQSYNKFTCSRDLIYNIQYIYNWHEHNSPFKAFDLSFLKPADPLNHLYISNDVSLNQANPSLC